MLRNVAKLWGQRCMVILAARSLLECDYALCITDSCVRMQECYTTIPYTARTRQGAVLLGVGRVQPRAEGVADILCSQVAHGPEVWGHRAGSKRVCSQGA